MRSAVLFGWIGLFPVAVVVACNVTTGEPIAADPNDGSVEQTSCTHGGMTYPIGASFPMGDNCNGCFCGDGGAVNCTTRLCTDGPLPESLLFRVNVPGKIETTFCTVSSEEIEPGDPWTFTVRGECGALGAATLQVKGAQVAMYPVVCTNNPSLSLTFTLSTLGGSFVADAQTGVCDVKSGPTPATPSLFPRLTTIVLGPNQKTYEVHYRPKSP